MPSIQNLPRWYSLRRLRQRRARQGRGYHEIVSHRRQRQMRRGRFKRGCLRLAYQIPVTILAALGFVVIIMHSGDRRLLTPEEIATAGFGYNLTSFEVRHIPAKWLHRLNSALPWVEIDDEIRMAHLDRYPDLARELRSARDDLKSALARGDATAISIAESQIDALIAERNRIRDAVEELLEAAISTELIKLGLHQNGEFIWPPVDFRIDDTPHVFVTSPRDEIQRDSVRLLRPDLTEQDKQQMEDHVFESADLSSVVLPTGGLASFPNLVPSDYSLQSLLEVSAHEWLHAYLLFHPLGRAYWSNGDMTSLNETLASRFGQEVGRTVYNQLTGEDVKVLEPPYTPHDDSNEDDPSEDNEDENGTKTSSEEFDPREYLHDTRLQTEQLLEQGKIQEAETYMEDRRQTLVENGHNIRKINQAYFAFHGTYADSPSSTSNLATHIWKLRQQTANVGQLVKTLQTITTYGHFLQLLDTHGIER